ncbi:MAG: ABC transporter permease subunit [Lachnospiraceae bacterium]|jgi:ABC-type nitrate/sulfonate/bicarbonate transport system permease component|nr:ABC transporter permease subunit [Lachnospiraceae bacterium]
MKQNKGKKLFYNLLPVLAIMLIVIGWISLSSGENKVFPTPTEVYERFLKTFTTPIADANIFGHVIASLKRVLTALLFSWTLGIVIGVLIATNKYCKASIGSLLEFFRPIPPIAWIPIIIMWFGIGEFPKVLLVFIGSFFPVLINTAAGISLVDRINTDVGIIFGGKRLQILKEIIIPTAVPSIFSGIRTSVSSGWTVVLAAEMMGAKQGLGALVMKGWSITDMALVLVAVIAIAIIGALLAFLLNRAERLVAPWNK